MGSYAGDQVVRAYLVGAQSFVPVREVLPMLDLTYQWDAKTKTLSTYPKTQTSTK